MLHLIFWKWNVSFVHHFPLNEKKGVISIADISIIYTEYCQKAHNIKTCFTPGRTSYFECIVSWKLIFGGQRNQKNGHTEHNSYSTTKSVSDTTTGSQKASHQSDWPKNTLYLHHYWWSGDRAGETWRGTGGLIRSSFNQRCEPQHQITIWWVRAVNQIFTRQLWSQRAQGPSRPEFRKTQCKHPGDVPSC